MSSSAPLQLIYTDVWGPSELSIDKFRYFLLFVDHYSKYIWLYPMQKKIRRFNFISTIQNACRKIFPASHNLYVF